MAIFKCEVSLDWINDEHTLDSELQERIIRNLSSQILAKFNEEAGQQMARVAASLIKAKTELLINSVLEKPVVISEAWGKGKEYPSIYDMVEQKMTALYTGKLDTSGQCAKDPLLSNIESVVKNETTRLLSLIEKKIQVMAKEESQKAVNANAFIKAIDMRIK